MTSNDTASKLEAGDYALELEASRSIPRPRLLTQEDLVMVMNMAVICVSWYYTIAYAFDAFRIEREDSSSLVSMSIAVSWFTFGYNPAWLLGAKLSTLIGARSWMAGPVLLYICVWLLQTRYKLAPVLALATGLVVGAQCSLIMPIGNRLTASPARTVTTILFSLSLGAPLVVLAVGTKWVFLTPDSLLASAVDILALVLSSFCAYSFPESASHRLPEE